MAKHAKASSQSPHFFRIILPHILENGTLELPKYFLKENWDHLSKHARLKVPNGDKSKMKLKMKNGRAWLHKGWQKFVEKYKIKCGYFLVFKYQGRSRFKVQIFDLSTLEIEYPRTSQEICKGLVQLKEEKECVNLDDDREMEVDDKSRELRNGQESSYMKDKSHARDQVLQRAMEFKSSNPHFKILMKPSYVSSTNYTGLFIPKDGRSYFCKKGNRIMYLSLKGGDGRVWSMKFKILAPRRQVYCSGWSKFSQENNLREGDICVFEVVNSMDVKFKVTILRTTDEKVDENVPLTNADPRGKLRSRQNSSSIKNKTLEISARDRVLQRAKAFQSPNPHFTVTMKPIYASYLHIPGPAKSCFPKKRNENIKLSLKGGDGRVWYVKNFIGRDGRVRIIAGWSKFLQENNLQEGDMCAFELVNSKAKEFKVTIFRISDEQADKMDPLLPRGKKETKNEMQTRKRKHGVDENGPLINDDPRGKLRSRQDSSSIKNKTLEISARDRVLQRAKVFQSPNPHFTVTMTPTCVCSNPYLHIPKGPAKSYFPKEGTENIKLSLKGGDGRAWHVKNYIGASPKCAVRITTGWSKFSQENNLQEGDICAFELVNSKAKEFKVTIFRISDEQVVKKDPLVPRGMKEAKNEMQTRKRKRGVAVKEYTTPLQRAKDFEFKCKEPSFTVMMSKTYVQTYNSILLIPKDHASRYLIDQHGEEIILHRLDGKTWPVKCYTSGTYTKRTKFCSGWKDFVVDNDLQVGDACVFELLPHLSDQYQVTIFRAAE